MDIHGESSSSSGFKLFGKTIVASEKADGQDQDQDDSTIIVADHEETYSKSEEIASENIATTAAAAAAASTKRGQLPCPRCKSKETKFCYFNNYNVNQPRHFCKACHRYWTAGGALRNVPVGAGRRKNRALPQGSGGGDGDDEGGGGGGGMCLAAAGGEEVERWLTS